MTIWCIFRLLQGKLDQPGSTESERSLPTLAPGVNLNANGQIRQTPEKMSSYNEHLRNEVARLKNQLSLSHQESK